MKKFNVLMLMAAFSAVCLVSCDDNNAPSDEDGDYGYNFTTTIDTYIDGVVIPTYTSMKDKVAELYDAVDAYQARPGTDNLAAICTAWRAARIPWEQSEGFLFGPAALLGLDPSLDSWPLDKGSIDRIIDGTETIDVERIASNNLHGFHAIEYLIFSDGEAKTTTLSDRELDYLLAAVEYLKLDTYQLWANWVGADAIDDDDVLAVLEENEIDVAYNFSLQFKKAGLSGSLFHSQDEAIDQIIEGCAAIADEVGAQKIGGPSDLAKGGDTQAVLEVESWYSWNSIADYANNIVSIRNSYFGGIGLTATTANANSLSAFVKSKDSALDIEITTAIEAAYDAIATQMERPFRNHLTGAKVDDARDACAELVTAVEKIKSLQN